MKYKEAVEYILNIPKFTQKNSLQNTKKWMEKLASEEKLGKVIHVAGTNGKGSVCAMLSSILQQAGYQVGLFSSPHLVSVTERFRINQVPVSEAVFLEAFQKVFETVKEQSENLLQHPTFFEWLFLMACVIFEKESVDFCILETGLGGRLDATNTIKHPAACVITSIGKDHTEYLGDTIEKISAEKAGICKPGVPVILDGTNKEAADTIKRRAMELDCNYQVLLTDEEAKNGSPQKHGYRINSFAQKQVDFSWKNGYDEYIEAIVPGIGLYQAKNAALAMMAARNLIPSLPADLLRSGIRNTDWPGRMEEVFPNIFIDGAHNPEGMKEFVSILNKVSNKEKIVLFSVVQEKNIEEMIEQICQAEIVKAFILTEIHNKRGRKAYELADSFAKYTKVPILAIPDIKEAFKKARIMKTDQGMIFCVGSLYLVGEIKTLIKEKKL